MDALNNKIPPPIILLLHGIGLWLVAGKTALNTESAVGWGGHLRWHLGVFVWRVALPPATNHGQSIGFRQNLVLGERGHFSMDA